MDERPTKGPVKGDGIVTGKGLSLEQRDPVFFGAFFDEPNKDQPASASSLRYTVKMKSNVTDAVNEQIRLEFESGYLYLQMAARFEAKSLKGFAAWLRLQAQEEQVHALKLYDFLLRRGSDVELRTIPKPEVEFSSPLEAFELVLQHEKEVTRKIHELYELAQKEKDYPLQSMLHWFIDEQVEEEDQATQVLDRLRMVGDSGPRLFLLDRELGTRSE